MQKKSLPTEDQGELVRLEAVIDDQERCRQDLVSREASLQNEVDTAEKLLMRAHERLRAEGGELSAAREQISNEVGDRRSDLELVEAELRGLAAEAVPLLLVQPLAEEAASLLTGTADAAINEAIQVRLAARQQALLDALTSAGLKKNDAKSFLKAMIGELTATEQNAQDDVWRRLAGSSKDRVALDEWSGLTATVIAALVRWDTVIEQVALAEAKQAAVPAVETIRHLVQAEAEAMVGRATALEKQQAVSSELEVLNRQLAVNREKLEIILKRRRETDRIALHSTRARDLLADFRVAVAARKLQSLEELIAVNFQSLLRKKTLVAQVSIDPATYELTVLGEDGIHVPTERLSAGERQLLAVAALWSLAQASGRELPVVIDTPLGRLDSIHRGLLVDNYFPHASHQVILLSTDEEVRGEYYERLQPYIGRQHLITYREKEKTSQFEDGYFNVGVAA